MKYNLNRDNALNQALSLFKRKFTQVYVSQTGIYPYESSIEELNRIMVTEPSCICDVIDLITALRQFKSPLVLVEHFDFPERIVIEGAITLYPDVTIKP